MADSQDTFSLPETRIRLEAWIEHAIAAIDALDGDADIEDGGDDEPSCEDEGAQCDDEGAADGDRVI